MNIFAETLKKEYEKEQALYKLAHNFMKRFNFNNQVNSEIQVNTETGNRGYRNIVTLNSYLTKNETEIFNKVRCKNCAHSKPTECTGHVECRPFRLYIQSQDVKGAVSEWGICNMYKAAR